MRLSITPTKRSPQRHPILIGEATSAVRSLIQTNMLDLTALNLPDIVRAIVVLVINMFHLATIRQTPNVASSTTHTYYPHN